jgi:DNA relaxase NicK
VSAVSTHTQTPADGAILLSWGCDWITGVALDAQSSYSLSSWCAGVMRNQRDVGNISRPWGMAGFSGNACGQAQIGRRDDECIVRLSGDAAARHWRKVYQLSDSVSRLDLQVTIRHTDEPRRRIRRNHARCLRWTKKQVRGPAVTIVSGSDGSDTLYLGKRQSNVFGRCYNKGVQSGEKWMQGATRYEVEYKGKAALLVARRLSQNNRPFRPVCGLVSTFFEKRGCASLELGANQETIVQARSRTDIDRRLRWLARAVSPSTRVIFNSGRAPELIRALGLMIDSSGALVLLDQSEVNAEG